METLLRTSIARAIALTAAIATACSASDGGAGNENGEAAGNGAVIDHANATPNGGATTQAGAAGPDAIAPGAGHGPLVDGGGDRAVYRQTDNSCSAGCGWTGEDFEDGSLDDWKKGTQASAIVAGQGASGSSKYLEVTTSSGTALGNHFQGVMRETKPCQPKRVSVWLNASSTASPNTFVVFGDAATGTGGANLGVLFFYAGGDGKWHFVNGTSGPAKDAGTIVANQWTHFVFDLDWSAKKLNITQDGVVVATAAAFRVTRSESVSRYFLYGLYANATSRFDDLVVTCN